MTRSGRLGGDEFVILAEGISLARGPRDDRRAHPRGAPARRSTSRDSTARPDHRVGQHRDRRRRPPVGRGSAARRRHRPVPGQGRGPRPVRRVRARHAVGGPRPARPQDGPATSALARRRSSPCSTSRSSTSSDIQIRGVEALLRWHHPTKGTITPDSSSRSSRTRGLIVDVGRWVLDEACRAGSPGGIGTATSQPSRSTSRCASSSPTASSTTSATALADPRARPRHPHPRDHRDRRS